jgi:hypothetical protein
MCGVAELPLYRVPVCIVFFQLIYTILNSLVYQYEINQYQNNYIKINPTKKILNWYIFWIDENLIELRIFFTGIITSIRIILGLIHGDLPGPALC